VRRHGPPAAVLAALTLAACGADGVPVAPDKTVRARQTLETFLDVCAQGRGLEALEILSEPARRVFLEAASPVAGCDRILQLTPLSDDAEETAITKYAARRRFGDARIVELSVTGGLAEARVRAEDEESTVELEDQGERWTVTSASLPLS
jgi:hypothetical protein